MKSYLLGVFKRSSLNISELLLSLILCSLALPRIINSITIGFFFLVSIFMFFRNKKRKISFNKLSYLFLVFFFYCSITSLWSIDFNTSFNEITSIASYVLLPLSFVFNPQVIRVAKVLYNFILGISILGSFMLINAVFKYVLISDPKVFFYHNLSNNIDEMNAIYFSVFVSFSFLYLLLKGETKLDKFIMTFLATVLVLLSSKTIIFVSFLLGVFIILKSKKNLIFNKIFILIFFGLLLVGSMFFKKRIVFEMNNSNLLEVLTKQEFGWQYKWSGLGIRVLQWRVFYELTKEDNSIVYGYGLRAANKRISEKHKELKLYSGLVGIDLHNQYLQFISELGIIGFLIYIFIIIILLKKAIMYKDLFLMIFVILITSVCFTEVFLSRQRGMVFFISLSLLFYNSNKYQIKNS
jgi:O-antigen ligase